jgi:HAD superfamily hydrolase (TIGR01484 family)
LPEFEVRIGGTTSIDVTKKGIDKAFGVLRIIERLHIDKEDVVFVGDALFEGGNDYAVKSLGIRCIETSGPQETLKIIDTLRNE